ncbi:MAG TPA: rhodanese-like domain-containing protein [Candidatus Paceibacterota bacterium]|nr:rhodanese-like domain-containing protein [Candidatus Paceibacterota bacterium]
MHADTPTIATPQEAHQAVLSHPDTVAIVDVRTQIEREAGFVSGSIHIPLDEFSARAVELARFEKVFVICRSGGRSAAACIAASRIGLTQFVNITGGMKAWEAAGLAVEKPN